MVENFEFALDQVKPGYVIALGGDDGLLPYGIRGMLDVLRATGQEMLAWPAPTFIYPKCRGMETAQLVLAIKHGRPYSGRRIIRAQDYLERQARELAYVSDFESPMFYVKGVTSTRLVEKVRSRSANRRFYMCATPDGYSGIVLAGEVQTYAFSGQPFSIYGASPASQGAVYLAAHEQAKKQSEAFFKHASNRPMHAELAGEPYSPLISLMTADYLLTARDLPGWPGSFPAIDYRNLLLKGLVEVANGLYAEDRVQRELGILYRIAQHHGLTDFFGRRVRSMRRNNRKTPLEGNAISFTRLYVDGSEYGIHNVFDAAYVAHYMHQVLPKLTLCTFWRTVSNSVRYRLRSMSIGSRLPLESIGLNK
jgi:hypothetical protein